MPGTAPALPSSTALAAPVPRLLWQQTAGRQHQAAEFSPLFQQKNALIEGEPQQNPPVKEPDVRRGWGVLGGAVSPPGHVLLFEPQGCVAQREIWGAGSTGELGMGRMELLEGVAQGEPAAESR